VRAVLKEHNETEGEEGEKNEPEEPPKQRHRATVTQPLRWVNAAAALDRKDEAAILTGCECRCWT